MTEGYHDVLVGLHPVGRMGEVSDVVKTRWFILRTPRLSRARSST